MLTNQGHGNAGISIVLVTDAAIRHMLECPVLLADATFKAAPQGNVFTQVWSLHSYDLHDGGETVPNAFIIMANKSQPSYANALQVIRGFMEEVEHHAGPVGNIRFVLSDWEPAEMAAFNQIFPELDVLGCQFHYGQIIVRRITCYPAMQLIIEYRDRNNPAHQPVRDLVKSALGLILCPPARREAMWLEYGDHLHHQDPNVLVKMEVRK